MENFLKNNKLKIWTLITMFLGTTIDAFAQGPPPPPAVPLDFGITEFIALCVGYGVVKMKKNKTR